MRKIATDSGREGYDLNDIVREILGRLREERGWSETELAKQLGIPQRTMNRIMHGQDIKLSHLSKICASLEVNPVDFFRSHPVYDEETRSRIRFTKDALYDRFRTLLTPAEARMVIESIEEQKRLHVFEMCSETIQGMIRVAKAARRFAIQEMRQAAARRRRPPRVT